jgi:hypothetical protein
LNIIKRLLSLLSLVIEDFFIVGGLFCIVYSMYMVSEFAGTMTLGVVLILVGIVISRYPSMKIRR